MSLAGSQFALLDSVGIPAFVLEVHEDGARYLGWNDLTVATSGISSESVAGRTATEVFGARLGRPAQDNHNAVARSGQGTTYRVTLPTHEGEKTFQTTLTPYLTDGVATHIIGLAIDVSALRDAEAADATRLIAIEEAELFVAMAAHDLRTPMRNVKIVAESLIEDLGETTSEIRRALNMLTRISETTSDMMRDVLAHAHAVAKAQDLTWEFRLRDLCDDVIGVLDPEECHVLDVPDVCLRADRTTLRILLQNLIDNALKYAGMLEVQLQIGVTPIADDFLEFTVVDDGQGFAEPALAFLDGGEVRYDSGFGLLGLRRLIEARGGTIAAAEAAHGGGEVRFTFPGRLVPQLVTS